MKRLMVVGALLVAATLLSGCDGDEPKAGRLKVIDMQSEHGKTHIVIEAEDYEKHGGRIEHPMKVEDDENASGGKCVVVEGGAGKPLAPVPGSEETYPARWGAVVYKFTVEKSGRYKLWGRKFWENGCGNSLAVVINGATEVVLSDETYDRWTWRDCLTSFELEAGRENTIEILNREDGVKLDKFIITRHLDFVPQGTE